MEQMKQCLLCRNQARRLAQTALEQVPDAVEDAPAELVHAIDALVCQMDVESGEELERAGLEQMVEVWCEQRVLLFAPNHRFNLE
jgi:hypothetical protein